MTKNKSSGHNSAPTVDGHSAPLTVTRDALLIGGKDTAFRAMVHAALAFSARLNAIRDGYAEFIGLSGPQYTILVSIQHLQDKGNVGVKQLADHLSLSGTFVTTETGKLEEAGYIVKVKDEVDKRRVSLEITPSGHALLSRLNPVQQQVNNVHFGPLSKIEFDLLCTIMPRLVASSDAGLSLLAHLSKVNDLS
jgi:DNA-binding MarR family transcriptional regulator